jgi:hypothetical protein
MPQHVSRYLIPALIVTVLIAGAAAYIVSAAPSAQESPAPPTTAAPAPDRPAAAHQSVWASK